MNYLKNRRVYFHASNFIRSFSNHVDTEYLRNISIIAHVDHGKTTLVDELMRQSHTKIDNDSQRVMDRNELEKERGITILSKCTSIYYNDPRIYFFF